jgi:23S rRNA (guanosine2251-2'-O)-methyltransferase
VVTNLNRTVKQLKDAGFWIYGADMNGTPAPQAKLTGRVALVLGSEGKGISRLTRDLCDVIVSIPTTGQLDSLNVSVSAGILMYEVRRQQG